MTGGRERSAKLLLQLQHAIVDRAGQLAEEGGEFTAIRRGWSLGEETFRQELLAQMGERLGAEHYGAERARRRRPRRSG